MAFLMLLSLAVPVLAMGQPPPVPTVSELANKISAELGQMDSELAQAAKELANTGLSGEATTTILSHLYRDHSSIVAASTINPDAQLVQIFPSRYSYSQGQSISDQAQWPIMKSTQQPILSGMFKTVEGFYATSLAYPILSSQGELIGFVSLVFKPDVLMRNIITPLVTGLSSVEVLAIQQDGRVIYDRDIMQIGKMTFSDPVYQSSPSLLELANRMTLEASGTGTYTFPVKKVSEWTTVGLHGTEWRLIVSQVVD